MEFINKRYLVNGWRGKVHFLTAKELYNRVIKDSKSNYNWIASATELVNICNKNSFPKEYAEEIKIAILNCFASLQLNRDDESICLATDYDAVYSCYNSLYGTDEKVVKAKRNYLTAVIKSIVLYHFECPVHHGPIYLKMCDEWIKTKIDKHIKKDKINFVFFIEKLKQDFNEMVRRAEKEGRFKEEDEEYYNEFAERCIKLMKSI